MKLDEITGVIVDAAVKVHQALGPGLLESVYEAVLARDLERRGLRVERQKVIAFDYDGLHFEDGLRVDLLVEGAVVVELKSVETVMKVHGKQVLTYLRLLDLRVGLLINFGAATLKEGLHRIVNNFAPSGTALLRVNQHEASSATLSKTETVRGEKARGTAEVAEQDVSSSPRPERLRMSHGGASPPVSSDMEPTAEHKQCPPSPRSPRLRVSPSGVTP